MSTRPRTTFRRDWGLTGRMFFVLTALALVYLGFVALLNWLGIPWGFIAVIAGVMLALQFFLSDKLVLWSMGARLVTPQQYPDLHRMIERLAAGAGLPKPKVAVVHNDIPNAFATGRSPGASVVAVTTGIMRRLTAEELEGVLGHELSHIRHRDVMVITLASFFATVAAMLMQWLFWMSLFGGMGGGRRNQAGAVLLIAYLASVLVYFVAKLLLLALSRYREYAADWAGAHLTGRPSWLASALQKISGAMARIPTEDLRRVETANAFFIVPALKGDVVAELFSTHPPVHKRVERLRRLARDLEGA